jgi:hypothetical protein
MAEEWNDAEEDSMGSRATRSPWSNRNWWVVVGTVLAVIFVIFGLAVVALPVLTMLMTARYGSSK